MQLISNTTPVINIPPSGAVLFEKMESDIEDAFRLSRFKTPPWITSELLLKIEDSIFTDAPDANNDVPMFPSNRQLIKVIYAFVSQVITAKLE